MNETINAQYIFDSVKSELSIRSNNYYTPTKMGGNPTEFFFTLTHKIQPELVEGIANHSFVEIDSNSIKLNISSSEKNKLRGIRLALSDFIKSKNYNNQVSVDDIKSMEFLRNHIDKSEDIPTLINALKISNKLNKILTEKRKILNEIRLIFEKERNVIVNEYIKEMNIIHANDVIDKNNNPIWCELHKHPIYSKELDETTRRHNLYIDNILSKNDYKLWSKILTFPMYITLFCTRTVLFENVVSFGLWETEDADVFSKKMILNEID